MSLTIIAGITFVAIFTAFVLISAIKADEKNSVKSLEDPVITENDVHEDLHSHVEPISEQTPPIVVIEPPVASVAPVVEELAVADETPAVVAPQKKKPAAKKKTKKVDA